MTVTRAIHTVAYCVLCVLVTACDNWEPLTCLPPGAAESGSVSTPAAVDSQAKPTPPTRLTVYLDATGSTRGFVHNGRPGGREPIYARLIRDLVDLPNLEPAIRQASAYKFGAWVKPIGWDDLDQARHDVAFYSDRDRGFNRESRLDTVMGAIERTASDQSNSDTVWVVGTDLVLTDSKDVGRNSRLSGPLGRIIRRGLSVGILAVKSRFKGPIYDLPFENGKATYDHDGYLGYYLLIIGENEEVNYLYHDYLARTLKDFDPDGHRFEVFSKDRLSQPVTLAPIGAKQGVQMREGAAPAEPLIAIETPQHLEFEFDRSTPRVSVRLDVSGLFEDGRSLAPRLEFKTRDWFVLAPKGVCLERWIPDQRDPTGRFYVVEDRIEFRISKEEMRNIAPKDVHYKRAEIYLAQAADADTDSWYQSWSLSDFQTPEV
ncbi:MAG: hypothetical protein ACREYC_12270, partial [Gammaproteobacteria bacterium]